MARGSTGNNIYGNLWLTQALVRIVTPIKKIDNILSSFQYFHVLRSKIHIFLYKEKRILKSAKEDIKALKR